MNVALGVLLEVDELQKSRESEAGRKERSARARPSRPSVRPLVLPTPFRTHLSRRQVRRYDELDTPVPEDPEYEPEEVPLLCPGGSLKDPDCLVDPSVLVVLPGLPLHRTLPRSVHSTLAWLTLGEWEPWADENGLDV